MNSKIFVGGLAVCDDGYAIKGAVLPVWRGEVRPSDHGQADRKVPWIWLCGNVQSRGGSGSDCSLK